MVSLGRTFSRAIGAIALLEAAVIAAPEALAFPYAARVGGVAVRSEAPIDVTVLGPILTRADALVAASRLGDPVPQRRLFLTRGGWRWHLLSLTSHGAFALTRPLLDTLVVNRNDPARDRVWNGRTVGGQRTLAGTIAHETTHIAVERHYGVLTAGMAPAWKSEGFADYVARESSLSRMDAETLRWRGEAPPALACYFARRRVAAILAGGGGPELLFRRS